MRRRPTSCRMPSAASRQGPAVTNGRCSRFWSRPMPTLAISDALRSAVRGLVKAPAVSVSAILCLGLGLGATAAIASAIDRALLKPLPFESPERLVTVYRTTPHFNTGPFSAPNYLDLAGSLRQIESLAAVTWSSGLLSLPDG